jgi:hypothetical protein
MVDSIISLLHPHAHCKKRSFASFFCLSGDEWRSLHASMATLLHVMRAIFTLFAQKTGGAPRYGRRATNSHRPRRRVV